MIVPERHARSTDRAEAEPRFETRRGLPRGKAALPPKVVEATQRRRLLRAVAEVAGTKGISDLTVADITAHAGVGRRSFYELFKDKHDCYLAAYRVNAETLVDAAASEWDAPGEPLDRLMDGFRAYLRVLDEQPVYARAFLLEALRAGPEALDYREQVHQQFIDVVAETYRRAREAHPVLGDVDEHAVIALIGGINELIYRELRRGDDADIAGLEPVVLSLVRGVLGLPALEAEETKVMGGERA